MVVSFKGRELRDAHDAKYSLRTVDLEAFARNFFWSRTLLAFNFAMFAYNCQVDVIS